MYMCFNTCGKTLNQTDDFAKTINYFSRNEYGHISYFDFTVNRYSNFCNQLANLSIYGITNTVNIGNNVTDISRAYFNCFNLIGPAVWWG